MKRGWASAKGVLKKLVVKNIFEYRTRSDIARDPKARFRLRRQKPRRSKG
jgi:hypothetical protein